MGTHAPGAVLPPGSPESRHGELPPRTPSYIKGMNSIHQDRELEWRLSRAKAGSLVPGSFWQRVEARPMATGTATHILHECCPRSQEL